MHAVRTRAACLLGAAAILLVAACTRSYSLDPVDGGSADSLPPLPDSAWVDRKCGEAAPVDLLFVIDNSGSMAEEQASLVAGFPTLVSALVSPPDRDGDRRPDWLPVPDLHVGVVTTDMGTGGNTVPTCTDPVFGDDGVLVTRGSTALAGCAATYPSFLSFVVSESDPALLARDFACVASVGSGGCGFEQQLDAMLKAVVPSTSPIRFAFDSTGHGDGRNAGFLRPDSLLGIVIVTDEEDCSAADPEIMNPTSSEYPGDLNLRCFMYPSAVHPIERYVDGLRALRPDRPELLAFAVIAGIPVDLASPTSTPFDAILSDPRMQEEIDPSMPTRLRPSCNVPGRGVAYPPRRLVEVARHLAPHSTVQSICESDFSPAVSAIAELVGRRACSVWID